MEDYAGLLFFIILALISAVQKFLNKGKEQRKDSEDDILTERKIVVVRTQPKRTVIPLQRMEPDSAQGSTQSSARRTLVDRGPVEFPKTDHVAGIKKTRKKEQTAETQPVFQPDIGSGMHEELMRFSQSSAEVGESVRRHLHVGSETVSEESQRKTRRKGRFSKLRKSLMKPGGARSGFVLSEVLGPNPHHPTMFSHGKYF